MEWPFRAYRTGLMRKKSLDRSESSDGGREIDKEAWEIIGTGFKNIVPDDESDDVPESGTGVPKESLLGDAGHADKANHHPYLQRVLKFLV